MSGRAAPARFVGVDTEGTLVAGRHRPVVVAASDALGRRMILRDPAGLDTLRILEWLGEVRDAYPGRRLVIFRGAYDWTQWLAGVPRSVLARLWRSGEARWYRLGQEPERVSLHLTPDKTLAAWLPAWPSRVTVSDVYGYFQSSFLDACQAWGEPVDAIRWGKAERGAFRADDDRVVDYCAAECAALARIMGRVAARVVELGARPASWTGAGSVAGALLRKRDARSVIAPGGKDVQVPALTAYYGGRVDALQQGSAPRVLACDLRSAYPWALAGAPSFRGVWRSTLTYQPAEPVALWRVHWRAEPLRALTPLPVRQPTRVVWPARGSGWYHADELAAAIRSGADVTIERGYVLTRRRGEPVEPWAWLRDVYAERQALRAAGDPGERVVKLALNSVYGKLAQSQGRAPYQCFPLAGFVTARVRALMLDEGMRAPGAVIGVHTDSLLLDAAAPGAARLAAGLDAGAGLGQWETHAGRNLLIVQPGVYTYDDDAAGIVEARRLGRTRGVPAKSLTWERVEDAWRAAGVGGSVHVQQTMHHGIGTCASRRRWATLGQWITETRQVRFATTSRFPSSSGDAGLSILLPLANGGDAVPYEPRGGDLDELMRREQPYPNG